MFDSTNPYTLRTEIIEDTKHYFVSFIDGEGIQRESEISQPVHLEFYRFVKQERNILRSDERHIEQSELNEEALYKQALNPPKSVEEAVLDNLYNERLQQVIAELPEIQRRRFILYYEYSLNYVQIAKIDGCSARAIAYSVSIAIEKIKKYFCT